MKLRLKEEALKETPYLQVAGIVSVSKGKGRIVKFFGPGTDSLGATATATICNMSAEIGSTSCIFPYTEAMARYLSATKRHFESDAAKNNLGLLSPDEGSDKYYDEVIEIDLDTLELRINGPYTPDLSKLHKFFVGRPEEGIRADPSG